MTKPNMKPFDPAHTGGFCTREGRPVTLERDDRGGQFPLLGWVGLKPLRKARSWTESGFDRWDEVESKNDLMCVVPKREVRIMTYANTTFREVMPDDISQEKARAVIEAAQRVVRIWSDRASYNTDGIGDLRAALGDDA